GLTPPTRCGAAEGVSAAGSGWSLAQKSRLGGAARMIFSGIHSDRGVRATIMGTMIFLRLVAKVHGAGCGWPAPVAMEGAAKCDTELLLYGNLTDCKVSKSRRLGSSIQRHRMITAAIVLWRVFELWAEQPLSINEIGAAIDRYRKASIIIGNTIAI